MHNNVAHLPPSRRLFLVVAALLALLAGDGGPRTEACSMPAGWRPRTPVERVLRASVVLYGRVLAVYPDDRFSYGSTPTTVYTAYVDVFLNITEAGL